MKLIEFKSNKEANQYIRSSQRRLIEILERIDSTFDINYDNNSSNALIDRANKILLHDPRLTKEKENLLHEILIIEVNLLHIQEVMKNNSSGFDSRGIKKVPLEHMPVIEDDDKDISGEYVGNSELASLTEKMQNKDNQSRVRRNIGTSAAGNFRPNK